MFCLFETLRFDILPLENSWSDSSISPFHIAHGQGSFSFRYWQGEPGKKYRANMDIRVYKYMQQRQEQQINFCLTNRSTELDTELTESGGRRNANRVHSELPPRPSFPGLVYALLQPANKLGFVCARFLALVLVLARGTGTDTDCL